MGKLTVKVHECKLFRPAVNGCCVINPRVTLTVDGTYRFQTHVKKDTFDAKFNESFVVGNTHRLAVIEISVYDVQEPMGLVLPGIGIVTATRGVVRSQNCTTIDDDDPVATSTGPMGSAGTGGGAGHSASSSTPPVLLGRCYISIQRLVHNQRKRRTFSLGTPLGPLTSAAMESPEVSTMNSTSGTGHPPRTLGEQVGPSLLRQSLPPGIAGTITISLESDSLGEPPTQLRLDDALEEEYVRRLRRFVLCHDKAKVQMLDLLMAHVRASSELVHQNDLAGASNSFAASKARKTAKAATATPRHSTRNGSLASSVNSRSSSPAAFLSTPRHDAPDPVALTPPPGRLVAVIPEGGRGDDDAVANTSGCASIDTRRRLIMRRICLGGRPELTADVPDECETFEELMSRLCAQYRASEPEDFRMVMRVDGCTNVDKDHWNLSFLGSDDVFVVLRSEAEEFVTETATLQNTVVWTEANTVALDVVNPARFYVMVILMGRGARKTYEIGRCCVSAAPLSQGHISARNMFLCIGEGVTRMAANGVAHLVTRPVNFGLTPIELADSVDKFYERLSRFFMRYDPLRLPEVDVLAKSRLMELETFMQDLVVEYGREPGSVRLLVAIESLISLRKSAEMDLDEEEVRLLISMGSSTVRTKSMLVSQFAPTKVTENYMFDVVRETDLIRVEVVNARNEDIVYGRVDFSCLNTQRSVMNKRDFYLVGAAGTRDAYFSGIVRLNLYSDEVGHTYEVDTGLEDSFAGRLRRYVHRRVPESLHRVNLAVATVFDMESFMVQLGLQYGEEDPTYALYFTVVGCRGLRSGFGGVDPYVVVRVGIDAYQTKTVKSNDEPDYFEFCEFYYDRPGDMLITLVVMDQSDIGKDEELGRAVIPLADVQPSKQYNDWLPLLQERKNKKVREVGTIGFKYTVVDLNLVDQNRLRLLKQHASHTGVHAPVVMEGARDNRGTSVGPTGEANGNGTSSGAKTGAPHTPSAVGQRWSSFKRYFHQAQLSTHGLRSTSSARGSDGGDDGSSDSNGASTHMVRHQDSSSFKSANSANQRMPTLNLMDGGIHSVEEFCTAYESPLASNVVSETEGDWSASLDFATAESATQTAAMNSRLDVGEVHGEGGSGSRMQLRVRLLSCTNLLKPTRSMISPYVLLSTICETHRSRVQFDTTEPKFNETFKFRVENPNIDYLSITVLTETPYGSKKLGHCTLSMRNVQRGTMRTRWTSLVVHPFKSNAMECGSIYLSLGAMNFGMSYLPSMDAENRLREQIREYLGLHARQQLHRLEWYVGEFSQLESVLLGGWLRDSNSGGLTTAGEGSRLALAGRLGGNAADTRSQAADIEVSIYGISHLYNEGFLAEGSVIVKARVNGRTHGKTRPVAGSQGSFVFPEGQEPLRFSVDEPLTTLVKISVIVDGKHACGDCFVSLADLHRGVAKERTLMLVLDSKTSHAEPIGLITLGILCGTFGSSAPAPTEEDLALHSRLTRFCYYYIPTELAMVDVKYATTLNVAAYLNRMSDKYGPEPGDFHLRVTVDRVHNLRVRRDNARVHILCIVRVGLQEFHSSIVEGEAEFVFCESFDVAVGLPSREKVELIVMRYYPSKNIEVGRTVTTLSALDKGEENELELALVDHGGTKAASVCGVLKVSVCPQDFGRERQNHLRAQSSCEFGIEGHSTMAQTTYLFMPSQSMMLTDHHQPQRPGRGSGTASPAMAPGRTIAESLSDKGEAAHQHVVVKRSDVSLPREGSITDRLPPASMKEGTSAAVTIVGFAGLTLRDAEVYLRVSERDTVLLKTKPIPVDQLVALEPASATFTIEDVASSYEANYTLKLGVRKLFGAEALCHADFGITRCPANRTVEKRLRLYDENGLFLGICRLSVSMPNVHLPTQQWRHLSPGVFEPLMDDVASLLATYTPKDLRRLDVLLCRAPDIRGLHRALRLQLAPSVVASVYLAVHKIDFHSVTLRHTCVVTASVGRFTNEVERRPPGASPVYPYGMSKDGISKLDFPLLRIDISETGPAALLTLSVGDRASKSKVEELGRSVVSLRALLTPAVFTMSEKVQVPLVSIRHAANRVHAALIGTITFSIMPPSFESYSSVIRFPSSVVEGFDREFVRYYIRRICRLMGHYDANSLVDIHARMYETYVSNRGWEKGLPTYLSDMVARWGPEVDECDVPPVIQRASAVQPPKEADYEPPSPKELAVAREKRMAE